MDLAQILARLPPAEPAPTPPFSLFDDPRMEPHSLSLPRRTAETVMNETSFTGKCRVLTQMRDDAVRSLTKQIPNETEKLYEIRASFIANFSGLLKKMTLALTALADKPPSLQHLMVPEVAILFAEAIFRYHTDADMLNHYSATGRFPQAPQQETNHTPSQPGMSAPAPTPLPDMSVPVPTPLPDMSASVSSPWTTSKAPSKVVRGRNDKPPHPAPAASSAPVCGASMTRIHGVYRGRYVSLKNSPKFGNDQGIHIQFHAYANDNGQGNVLPFRVEINATAQEAQKAVPKKITYLGAVYPDGASLSYFPIYDLTLVQQKNTKLRRPDHRDGGSVIIRMSRKIYEQIKTDSAQLFLERFPECTILYPCEIEFTESDVMLEAMARGYRRLRIITKPRVSRIALSDALAECSHDLSGKSLVHVRFDMTADNVKRAVMRVVFFGMEIEQNEKNYFQKVFRIKPSYKNMRPKG